MGDPPKAGFFGVVLLPGRPKTGICYSVDRRMPWFGAYEKRLTGSVAICPAGSAAPISG